MVNADMVGRLREHRLYVSGVDSGTGLRTVVNDAAAGPRPLARASRRVPSGRRITRRSTRRAVPSCSSSPARTTTTTGPATRGTRSTRRAWPRVATLAARVVDTVAARRDAAGVGEGRRAARRQPGRVAAATARTSAWSRISAEQATARRPACGSAACGPGSPADKAGLKGGDVIVRFAGVNVRTLEDFTFALRGRRAGRSGPGRRATRRQRAAAAGRARGATLMSLRDLAPALPRARCGRRAGRLCPRSGGRSEPSQPAPRAPCRWPSIRGSDGWPTFAS